VRKQYHFRPGPEGLRAWDVDRLIALAGALPTIEVSLDEISDLDRPYWYDRGYLPTCRSVLEHMRLIQQVDLQFPIILSSDGGVMDGMHRVARAVLEGRAHILAKRFSHDPAPDYVGLSPDELPYPDTN
jgi:hypothetical protein